MDKSQKNKKEELRREFNEKIIKLADQEIRNNNFMALCCT
jgi:hypothetical protein